MESQEYPSHTTFHWQLLLLDLWKIEIPGHSPVFSHLVSQKTTRLVIQHHFYLRETSERDMLAGHSGAQKTLSQINVISYHLYLNSGASHGRQWKNSKANNRNMLNEEQREGMISWPQNMVVQKQLLIQEVPVSDWQKAGGHLMSCLLVYLSAALDPSRTCHWVFALTCMQGPCWFLSSCEFAWVSAAGSETASPPWDLVLDMNFPLKTAVGDTHRDARRALARIWSEAVNFVNKCGHIWGASVDGGIWSCSRVGQNHDLWP